MTSHGPTQQRDWQVFDAVGVGIGPFNLSAAALASPVAELDTLFFERESKFEWHPGLLFQEATIQVNYLKDLVTLADPTSRYSFVNFLFEKGRLYHFINASFPQVTRIEFNQYFQWVCAQLHNLKFGHRVEAISHDQTSFVIDTDHERVRARHVILGSGPSPLIPECARPHLGATVFHASRYLTQNLQPAGKRIAVVGGGQTGAEIVSRLMESSVTLPSQILWITRRANFLPMVETGYVEDIFNPGYSLYFQELPEEEKARLLEEQKLASDGISPTLIQQIYQRQYKLRNYEEREPLRLLPGRALKSLEAVPGGWLLEVQGQSQGWTEVLGADVVVLCTGYEYRRPSYLDPLASRITWSKNRFVVRKDFSIEWDGPPSHKIFVQNAARHSHGVAEPNFSIMAWRAATIVNSLAGRCIYWLKDEKPLVHWPGVEM